VQISNVRSYIQRGALSPVGFADEASDYVPLKEATVWRLFCRSLYLIYAFAPAIMTSLMALFFTSFRIYWYRMLTCGISMAGAAFIKWGQWASTRPDMFPVSSIPLPGILMLRITSDP
jgi:hypothetical protein